MKNQPRYRIEAFDDRQLSLIIVTVVTTNPDDDDPACHTDKLQQLDYGEHGYWARTNARRRAEEIQARWYELISPHHTVTTSRNW